MRDLVMLVKHQIDNGHFPSVHPHHTFLYPLPNTLRKAIATAHATAAKRNIALLNKPPYDHSRAVPLKQGERLRVGYVSSDFKVRGLDETEVEGQLTCRPLQDHPTSHLMQSVPGYHDRAEFEVFCYSLAPDDGSTYRQKIATEVGTGDQGEGVP